MLRSQSFINCFHFNDMRLENGAIFFHSGMSKLKLNFVMAKKISICFKTILYATIYFSFLNVNL